MAELAIDQAAPDRYVLKGALSYATTPQVWRRGSELFAQADAVVLDLGGVTRADSAGLALLVEWMRLARKLGKVITYDRVPAQLLSLAQVCGVEGILSLTPA